ncbi:MAG: hypothetical protein WD595_00485, partial [Waddliaceae bacterium]
IDCDGERAGLRPHDEDIVSIAQYLHKHAELRGSTSKISRKATKFIPIVESQRFNGEHTQNMSMLIATMLH